MATGETFSRCGSAEAAEGWILAPSVEEVERWVESLHLPPDQLTELGVIAAIYSDTLRLRVGSDTLPVVQIPLATAHGTLSVRLSVKLPREYPAVPPLLNLHSSSLPKENLLEIRDRLSEVAQGLTGEVMVFNLADTAKDELDKVPLAKVSDYFVVCPRCNVRLLNKKQEKHPQPAAPVRGEVPAISSSAPFLDGSEVFECLVCHGRDCVPLPMFHRNSGEDLCSFCFCEENPMLGLPCSCRMCTACFQNMAGSAVGSKALVVDPSTGHATVACPIHRVPLRDVNLFKLLDPAGYARYNRFAFEQGAAALGAVSCPLPGCGNYSFLSDVSDGVLVLRCPFCGGIFCGRCQKSGLECQCPALAQDDSQRGGGREVDQEQDSDLDFTGELPEGAQPFLALVKFEDRQFQVPLSERCEVRHLQRHLRHVLGLGMRRQLLFFGGRLLRPQRTPLREFGVGQGAVLYLMQQVPQQWDSELMEERELWKLRRRRPGEEEDMSKFGKKCPHCHVWVAHYYNHGCHHIGYAEPCCGKYWCYLCGAPHHNCGCEVGCFDGCGCPPCPTCRPGRPCSACWGCPNCR
eukprot:RCo038866